MTLTNCQKQAKEEILKFLLSDKKQFVLSGSAGTGKTYLIQQLKSDILKEYNQLCSLYNAKSTLHHLAYTALTNKAANVLQDTLGEEALTVHKYLGLRLLTNFKTGEQYLSANVKLGTNIRQNTLLIVDEYSMIDYSLYNFIHQFMDNSCKIIYLGDAKQLLSVKSSDFKIADKADIHFELKEQVRAKNNLALQNLCETLKNNVSTGSVITLPNLTQNFPIVTNHNIQDFIENNYKQTNHEGVFLAYTNKLVHEFNSFLRNDIRQLPKQYTIGEKLINNHSIRVSSDITLNTDDTLEIINVKPDLIYHKELDFNYYKVYFKGLNTFVTVPEDYNIIKDRLKTAKKEKDWHKYYAYKESIPDLRLSDARTVHKSQGSTYDWVMIDYNDLLKCTNTDTYNRLLYVAASRAKNNLFIYDY